LAVKNENIAFIANIPFYTQRLHFCSFGPAKAFSAVQKLVTKIGANEPNLVEQACPQRQQCWDRETPKQFS
jgi:hypothetical protein